MRLSVIIVSYNTRDLLCRCLESLDSEYEVIVVDNASSDGSVEMLKESFPQAVLIENSENKGFGAANNQGFGVMTGEVALLLNSDAFATPGAVARLLEVMHDPSVVACGGRLVHPGGEVSENTTELQKHLTQGRGMPPPGTPLDAMLKSAQLSWTQNSCANRLTLWSVACEQTGLEKLFPSSTLLSPYWTTRRVLLEGAAVSEVEQVMGACLMMRPVERFDERFFLYCEDTELCHRLRRHGRIVYVSDALFGHELGGSSTGNRWKSVALYNRGKELYFGIHHGRPAMVLCFLLDRLGALIRFLGGLLATILTLGLAGAFRRKCGMFAKVLFAPVHGPR